MEHMGWMSQHLLAVLPPFSFGRQLLVSGRHAALFESNSWNLFKDCWPQFTDERIQFYSYEVEDPDAVAILNGVSPHRKRMTTSRQLYGMPRSR